MAVNSRTAVSGRRTRTWLIGVYIRLSKEDARHLDESESVTNQRSIIEDYIASMDDGDEYRIVDEYVDDGISGTTDDEREDFQRMLKDIRRGRVNCVIVKDLARSFRNYSDQGYYLDDWFPRYNVRFISLYHQPLDSYKEPKLMRSIAVPIQGVLNENHCAETSEKIREVFDIKRRNGEHIGSFAAYGWRKDPFTGEKAFHRGVDLACGEGTPVLAALDGVVTAARRGTTYGNYVRLTHGDGQETLYAHMQYLYVRAGEVVAAGQRLGTAGQTGRATGAHLHFEFLTGGIRYDPSAALSLP